MPCPYKEGSEMCWLCWYWIEAEERCIFDEDDPEREFLLIDEFKDIDPKTYKERMEWLKGLGLMSLYRAVKAGIVSEGITERKEQQRTECIWMNYYERKELTHFLEGY